MLFLLLGVLTALALVAVGYAWRAHRRLERGLDDERRNSATLEHAVVSRTQALEDAQRVLKRMWWLGQQISLELNPQRVLERFLEAAVDIAQADGGAVGLLREDGKIHIVAGSGAGAPLVGSDVPLAGSAMGRVLRGGGAWSVPDVQLQLRPAAAGADASGRAARGVAASGGRPAAVTALATDSATGILTCGDSVTRCSW